MEISKSRIERKIARKRNLQLRDLIIAMKKSNNLHIASLIAEPKRKKVIVNLGKLDKETKEGDKIIVPGKVLGIGEIKHKITIAAVSFSEDAKSKLKDCKIVSLEEATKNKDFKLIK